MLKLGFHLTQGIRSENPTLRRAAHVRVDMALNALIGSKSVEDQFKKLSDNRGIDLFCNAYAFELNAKTRYEAFKAPTLLSIIEDVNMKHVLDHMNNSADDDNEIIILVGIMFDFNDREYEIVEVYDDYIIAMCTETNERIDLLDLSFVSNACAAKLE